MTRLFLQSVLGSLLLVGCQSSILDDPSTTIQFQVPEPAHVKLTIENSYNTVVATLVDGDLDPGYYSAFWDGNGVPSGIYFYTMEARGLNSNYYLKQTRQMLVLK